MIRVDIFDLMANMSNATVIMSNSTVSPNHPLLKLFEAALTPTPLQFVISLLAVIAIPILIHNYLASSSSVTTLPSIVVVGPLGSGKTSLQTLVSCASIHLQKGITNLSQLERGQAALTHTSQSPLTVECSLPINITAGSDKYRSANDAALKAHKKFFMTDTPGHGKLRHHALSNIENTKNLRGIIFVVDAANLSAGEEGVRQAAEYLHDTLLLLQKRLTNSRTSKGAKETSVLVAANKMDLFTALPATVVKNTLEKEISKIRDSRSKGLLDSGAGADDVEVEENDEWLGEMGSTHFKFDQMAECNVSVEVVGGSATSKDGSDAQKWWSWIAGRL